MLPITLADDVVLLSAPTVDDVDAITRICKDPEVRDWTVVPHPYTRDDAVGFVEQWVAQGWAEDRERTWAIRAEGVLAGMVSIGRRPVRSGEVGYWMAPEARGRGLLHRALHLVLDHAFDVDGMDLDRVEWYAYAGNWPSWRAAWRVGFRFEGARRAGAVQRGLRRDDWVGSLLRDDPRRPGAPWPATTVDPLVALPPEQGPS